jgi:hypothetical protein
MVIINHLNYELIFIVNVLLHKQKVMKLPLEFYINSKAFFLL